MKYIDIAIWAVSLLFLATFTKDCELCTTTVEVETGRIRHPTGGYSSITKQRKVPNIGFYAAVSVLLFYSTVMFIVAMVDHCPKR